ncbi:M20/M25/M40 family metallo-hydrolase [Photobacterium sp. SDRW27]|uniref:M28 family metallopeptidase n=1 Tax=Photobacterium obscurum TaxID=2829490 RepID=UPI002242E274|nr:M20/M25/M40 family metallo-hydrolase [Photobacterium obscurum]MCW8331728.1 M20/M25/M40 family metallo-hydrolase [Photobacterium obscurum]
MRRGIFCYSALAIAITLAGCNSDNSTDDEKTVEIDYGVKAMEYLTEIADETTGIGAREASSQQEIQTGNWIYDKLTGFGYDVLVQPFTYVKKVEGVDTTFISNNYIVEKKGAQDKTILLSAHYDSTGSDHGSLGATDNGAGLAAAIAIAEKLQTTDLPYNVRILLPGAEENGLNGSLHYVKNALANGELDNVISMINYDTVGGGDIVYVHAAHSDYNEYKSKCESLGLDESNYNKETTIRDAMLQASIDVIGEDNKYIIHPALAGYPEGETGSWSDHAGFACAGIPIAYVEATNFNINGEYGYDGYSQTTNPQMWDCYDAETKTACDRDTETKWGKIWHTEYDKLDKLEEAFPGRVSEQVKNNVNIVIELLTNEKYFIQAQG